jgi:hypothetical protein
LQHLLFAVVTTPLLFTFRRTSHPPIPAKGPLGSIPRLKAASLQGSASPHLFYHVYRNTVRALHYGKYFTAWYFPISERFPDIWDVTRCWVRGFRRFEDRVAFVLCFQLFLLSWALQILGNTFYRNVSNHSPNDATWHPRRKESVIPPLCRTNCQTIAVHCGPY